MPESNDYTDVYPVPREWSEKRVGQTVSFVYRMSLDDLIEVEGIDGMNDYLDAVLKMHDAALTDISYRVHSVDDNESVLIRAEGVCDRI